MDDINLGILIIAIGCSVGGVLIGIGISLLMRLEKKPVKKKLNLTSDEFGKIMNSPTEEAAEMLYKKIKNE